MFFSRIPQKMNAKRKEAIIQLLETPYQLEPPVNRLKMVEVQEAINNLNPKNS
jgi:hypothetical protein